MSAAALPALAARRARFPGSDLATIARLHLTYTWRHRRLLSLRHPGLFNELIQWRKLHDRDPRFPGLIDKIHVKSFVADRLGPEWVTPTLWSGGVLPDQPGWPRPFVVKSRHGCRQVRFVRDPEHDWHATRAAAARWMRGSYGGWLDEWGYSRVPPGLLVEPFVGRDGVLPIDYKLFVFHGRVEAIQVHVDREHGHRWTLYDRSWRPISRMPSAARPASLPEMIAGAEILARGFDFVRVDLYEIEDEPRFGEMTFYPGSGLDPFASADIDLLFGRLWLAPDQRPAIT